MEIRQLRYFVATVEAGTVSRAAQRCRIAQPSLSQQLKKLEHSLGIQLFSRQSRRMILTDAGRALLPRARRILADFVDVEANLKREIDHSHGRLAVGAIPTIAPYVLPDALHTVLSQRPGCEITVREDLTENLVESLLDHEIDCALLATASEHELIEIDPLGSEELLAVVPAAWPVPRDGVLNLADLRDRPTISLHEMHCLGEQVNLFCQARSLRPRVVCQTTQLSTIIKLVSLGMGISLVPEMTACEQPAEGCRYLRLRGDKPTRQLGLAWRKGRTRSPAGRAFAAAVESLFKNGRYRLKK